jgi:hypothetical protein
MTRQPSRASGYLCRSFIQRLPFPLRVTDVKFFGSPHFGFSLGGVRIGVSPIIYPLMTTLTKYLSGFLSRFLSWGGGDFGDDLGGTVLVFAPLFFLPKWIRVEVMEKVSTSLRCATK